MDGQSSFWWYKLINYYWQIFETNILVCGQHPWLPIPVPKIALRQTYLCIKGIKCSRRINIAERGLSKFLLRTFLVGASGPLSPVGQLSQDLLRKLVYTLYIQTFWACTTKWKQWRKNLPLSYLFFFFRSNLFYKTIFTSLMRNELYNIHYVWVATCFVLDLAWRVQMIRQITQNLIVHAKACLKSLLFFQTCLYVYFSGIVTC